MGGDEFVLILPNLPKEIAAVKMEDLRQMVGKIGESLGDHSMGLSVGAAYYPLDGQDAEDLLTQADRKMYNMKLGLRVHSTEQDFKVLCGAGWQPAADCKSAN
jgi:diguanylate cyclase (GGDEF)-like protein